MTQNIHPIYCKIERSFSASFMSFCPIHFVAISILFLLNCVQLQLFPQQTLDKLENIQQTDVRTDISFILHLCVSTWAFQPFLGNMLTYSIQIFLLLSAVSAMDSWKSLIPMIQCRLSLVIWIREIN